jgi:hypothetical protein
MVNGGGLRLKYVAKKDDSKKTPIKKQAMNSSGSCYRCGYTGHYSPDCYASRHKNGYELDD